MTVEFSLPKLLSDFFKRGPRETRSRETRPHESIQLPTEVLSKLKSFIYDNDLTSGADISDKSNREFTDHIDVFLSDAKQGHPATLADLDAYCEHFARRRNADGKPLAHTEILARRELANEITKRACKALDVPEPQPLSPIATRG